MCEEEVKVWCGQCEMEWISASPSLQGSPCVAGVSQESQTAMEVVLLSQGWSSEIYATLLCFARLRRPTLIPACISTHEFLQGLTVNA